MACGGVQGSAGETRGDRDTSARTVTGRRLSDTFMLDTIASRPLPFVQMHDKMQGRTLELVSEQLRLYDDSTFGATTVSRMTTQTGATETAHETVGRFQRSGEVITLMGEERSVSHFQVLAGGSVLRGGGVPRPVRGTAIGIMHIYRRDSIHSPTGRR